MDLKVDFKEAGLESGSVETITAAAHLDATYQCINGGPNNPSDAKKTTVSAEVVQSGQFTTGKNATSWAHCWSAPRPRPASWTARAARPRR